MKSPSLTAVTPDVQLGETAEYVTRGPVEVHVPVPTSGIWALRTRGQLSGVSVGEAVGLAVGEAVAVFVDVPLGV